MKTKMRRILSLLITAVMVFGYGVGVIPSSRVVEAVSSNMSFSDVKEGDWFYPYVAKVYESGLMLGKSDTLFEPEIPVTRAEITTILARLSGDNITGMAAVLDFKDTDKNEWYADYVGWAVKNRLVLGYDDGTFQPDKPILRMEIATMFVRFFDYASVSFPGGPLVDGFTDEDTFDWAADYIESFRLTGLVQGDANGKFNPSSETKRSEVATMLVRYTENAVTDVMYEVIEEVPSLVCKTHGYAHYLCAAQETAVPREDLSLSKMGAVIRDKLGLDADIYEVVVSPVSNEWLNGVNFEIQNTFSSETGFFFIKIKNRITGEETAQKRIFAEIRFDVSKTNDAIGLCYNENEDALMMSVWNNLDDYYVFNKDGKVHIPTNIFYNKQEFSNYFVEILLPLMNNRAYGYYWSDEVFHEITLSDEDFDSIWALRRTGGEVTVTFKLRNKMLNIETDEKTFDIVIMNDEQSKEYMGGMLEEIDGYLRELALLLGDCGRAGLATPYEDLSFAVIEKFAHVIVPDFIETGVYERTAYLERSIEKIYLEAKESLETYLAGEKVPMDVPQYTTSELEVDGFTIYANTVDSEGNVEKRPVYFYGYGDGTDTSVIDIPEFSEYGNNTFHYYEVMMNEVVRPATPEDVENVSADGKYVIDTAGILSDMEALRLTSEHNQATSLMLVRGDPWSLYEIYPGMYNESVRKLNFHHEKVREITEAYLRAIVPLFMEYGSVNNIVLTNESAYNTSEFGDFYVPMWAEFLKDRYNNDLDALNEAHRAEYSDWADAPLLDTESLIERNVLSYDNQVFNAKVHAEWHGWITGIIKEMAPDIPISTKLKTTEYDRPLQRSGVRVEDFAEFVDLGGCDDVHDDIIYYDHIAYAGESPVVDSEAHIYMDFEDRDFSDQNEAYVERVIWRGFMHHLGIGNLFAWDFWHEAGNTSLSAGDVTVRPTAMYNIGKVTMDANRLSYEIDAIVSEEADVAVLYSYASRHFTYYNCTETMCNAYYASLYNGEKVRIVSESQIEKINKCKILIIPECENVLPETIEAIAEFQKNGGRVVIFGHDSLTKNEQDLPHEADMQSLANGIKKNAKVMTPQANMTAYKEILEDVFKDQGVQRVWLVDAVTGEVVGGETEWLSAEYNGKLVVTAYATNTDKDLQVKVVVDGKVVTSSVELRSGEVYGEVFTLSQDECILLSIGEEDLGEAVPVDVGHKTSGGLTYAVLSDGTAEIIGYTGDDTAVSVPAELDGFTVSSVGAFAFDGSEVTSVVLPETVTDIEEYAFYNCDSLVTASLGSPKAINDRTFYDCDSLVNIVIPDSVTLIGDYAFASCESLVDVVFSDNITSIGQGAFFSCKSLASLDLPESLVDLGPQAFRNCSGIKGTVDIPYGITEVRYFTFSGCSGIEELIIPNSVVTLGQKALQDCSGIKNLELPNSLTSIKGHSLTGITAPIEFKHGIVSTGSLRVENDMYLPATISSVGEYVTIAGGKILCEAGSFIERYCIENGKDHVIVERDKHVHTPGAEATCSSHQTCTDCGAVVMPSFGHDYRVEADENGKAVRVCRHCGDTEKYEK